ncbi:MAG: ATP-dependent Clp protease adaptor ClpS [Acidobacteria bacterium]|nr:ATP-dependent Clp protease adaptor ClpS [Acidobacteriota bacterium]MBI3281588.1 ATP-dependent Clp protease adaptor ClpS [Acidobacteriota bacterium]
MQGQTFTLPEAGHETREELEPMFNVVLLDDDDHTYDYVVEMLQRLFLFGEAEAYRHAVEVDTVGRTIVLTCPLREAEFGRDQIHGFGPDWRMPRSKRSMKAVIEPVGGSERRER